MGEVIKVIHEFPDGTKIEVNKGSVLNGKKVIHIQNPKFRFSVEEDIFLQMLCEIRRGKVRFNYNKGISDYGDK